MMLHRMALVFIFVGVLSAQRYGPGRTWWNAGDGGFLPWDEAFEDPDGQVGILNRKGALRTDGHPFFEPLGANRRACVTCHQPANAMSISASTLRDRWKETDGKDPVFAAIDGSNCPDLPQGAAASHSLLLDRGLFRIFLPWPPRNADGTEIKPEFQIEVVRDPTGCNTSRVHGLASVNPAISVYRRPRVAANLDYVIAGPAGVTFMADGRESSLQSQAASAIRIHEQAEAAPSEEQLRRIVEFERQVFVAQTADVRGGLLTEKDAPLALGPENLASGKSGVLDADPRSPVRQSFAVWRKPDHAGELGLQREFRASVARGSDLFFDREFQLPRETAAYTCARCHNSGTTRWMDIGTANTTVAQASADLPLFRVTCDNGRVVYTQDPGRALISGKCADAGAIVLQQLRGLAARAPYFSNGSAQTLREVVDFYNRRFGIGYSEREKQDLVNFLLVL